MFLMNKQEDFRRQTDPGGLLTSAKPTVCGLVEISVSLNSEEEPCQSENNNEKLRIFVHLSNSKSCHR